MPPTLTHHLALEIAQHIEADLLATLADAPAFTDPYRVQWRRNVVTLARRLRVARRGYHREWVGFVAGRVGAGLVQLAAAE